MTNRSAVSASILIALLSVAGCSSNKDKNRAPSDILLSSNTVAENAVAAQIGTLSAVDPDSKDTHVFTTSDDRFVINGSTLTLAEGVAFNFEKNTSVNVEITATDQKNNAFTKSLTINIEDILDRYDFGERVSYSGQVARQLLLLELTNYIDSQLETDLANSMFSTKEEVVAKLMSFYKLTSDEYELEVSQNPLTVSTTPDAKQTTLAEISEKKKDLHGKIAGVDEVGQHKNWTTEFVAFGDKGTRSPDEEIIHLFNLIADNAEIEYFQGNTRLDPFGNTITKVYVSETGLDYKQLIQKILQGALNFSQGADDYLDNDIEGKGLLSTHKVEAGDSYSKLEHQFDEGFGYFGASRDYLEYSDDEIAKKGGRAEYQGMHDTNGDGMIDFNSEFVFGHSQNAAKRDRGTASNTMPTDMTKVAMEAFIAGRKLLADTAGTELTDEQMTELLGYRDVALMAWEKAIAATAVHYVNDTKGDYDTFGTDDFSFADLAKHWSELKGFVVSLQFNPHSPLSDENHMQVNTLIGDAPVLTAEGKDAFVADLIEARGIIAAAYGFNAENTENW